MYKLIIEGNGPLHGHVKISGAKNAVLPLMTAALLTEDELILENVPDLSDVRTMLQLLNSLGVKSEFKNNILKLKADNITNRTADYEIVKTMRASYYVLGPLLTRFGDAQVSLPGGCVIGVRPIDIHLKSFEEMGAKITIKGGYINAKSSKRLKGAHISTEIFHAASHGATCNVLMAAVLADGITIIENAAKEPEVIDLIKLLNKMGAKIKGAGTSTLTVTGVAKLKGATYSVIPDRIEAGTYAIAAAITKGKIELSGARTKDLMVPLEILKRMGILIEETENGFIVDATSEQLKPQNITTEYFPGFPTDLQAQFVALLTLANGESFIKEKIWENRFMHVPELNRMGANITVTSDHTAIIQGVEELSGAKVMATDLRASVALVLAALSAKGTTHVGRIYHLDRGYEKLEEKLRACGAKIKRVKDTEAA